MRTDALSTIVGHFTDLIPIALSFTNQWQLRFRPLLPGLVRSEWSRVVAFYGLRIPAEYFLNQLARDTCDGVTCLDCLTVSIPGLASVALVRTDLCTSAEGSLLFSSTTSPSWVSAISSGCSCLQRL